MSVETTPAASSTVEVDVFNGQEPTLAEFNEYREKGEVPERFKPTDQTAASEPAATLEKTDKTEGEDPKPASDSEPDKQEPETKADKRIKQLLAERYQLEQKLAAATKQGEKQDSTPAKAEPQSAFPKPKVDDKNADGTPKYAEYEDFTEAVGRWAAKEERATWEREQVAKDMQKQWDNQMGEARTRYADADAVISPTLKAIDQAKMPQSVHEVFGRSDVFFDLCYLVGSKPEELESFLALAKSDPRAAIGKVFDYERGIKEELAKPRDDKGKFTAPEPKKTNAPKPPVPVSGGSSRAFDVSDDSLSADEWHRQRNKQIASKT